MVPSHFACEFDGFLDDMVFEEGVFFAKGYPPEEDEEVIVSEETCFHYAKLACERYVRLHPEDKNRIDNLLSRMPK